MTRRLVSVVLALTVLIVVGFSIPLVLVVQSIERDDEARDTRGIATSLAASIDNGATAAEIEEVLARLEADSPELDVTVFGRGGASFGQESATGPSAEAAFAGRTVTRRIDGMVVVDEPNNGPFGADSAYVIRVAADEDDVGPDLTPFSVALVISALVALCLAAATTVIAARSIALPTGRLTAAARRLTEGDLETEVPVGGPPETRDLARALDALARRVRELLEAERESVADLAHRLRSPVTALHLEIEALPPGEESQQLLDRVHRLERDLNEVIAEMRRPEETPAVDRADLCAVTEERLADWRDVAAERGDDLTVAIRTERPRMVAAGSTDLEAAIDVLVDNAVTHTPRGTTIEVTVLDGPGGVHLVVDDNGPGFPAGPLAARGVSTGSSSGLGLDIARRTVERAGGSFDMTTSPGGGARVVLVFPVTS